MLVTTVTLYSLYPGTIYEWIKEGPTVGQKYSQLYPYHNLYLCTAAIYLVSQLISTHFYCHSLLPFSTSICLSPVTPPSLPSTVTPSSTAHSTSTCLARHLPARSPTTKKIYLNHTCRNDFSRRLHY